MLQTLVTWAAKWGDVASIVGLAGSLVGFGVTIYGVFRSKSAADRAEAAAVATRDAFVHVHSIADLSAALAIMEEIKRLQREAAWRVIPDRYSALRVKLIGIHAGGGKLSESHRQALQSAIGELADLEQRVERALSKNAAPPNPAKFNEIVSSLLDKLHVVLSTLQNELRK